MNLLVLFGSTSDAFVYEPLIEELKKNHTVDFYPLSAHRNPVELDEVLTNSKHDLIVAGAGISAHLPGVVASKVKVPVIGIPVASQFQGFDALMSIQQMPYGVPVLTMAPNDWKGTASFINSWKRESMKLNIVLNPSIKDHEDVITETNRLKELLEDKNISYTENVVPHDDKFNIILTNQTDQIYPDAYGIHVPLISKQARNSIDHALITFNWVKAGGAWVGVNNSRNAVLMAMKLMNEVK